MEMKVVSLFREILKFRVLSALTIASLLFACSKDTIPGPEETVAEAINLELKIPDIEEGRLVFENEDDYEIFVTELLEARDQAAFMDTHLPGFEYMRKGFDQIDFDKYAELPVEEVLNDYPNLVTLYEENGEQYVEENSRVFHPWLANPNGIYQVGDQVLKTTIDGNYLFDKAQLASITDFNEVASLPSVEFKPFQKPRKTQELEVRSSTECINHYERKNNHWKGKIKGLIEEADIKVFSNGILESVSVSASTTHYRRGAFGIWFRGKTNNLGVDLTGFVAVLGGGTATVILNIDESVVVNNESRVSVSKKFCLGGTCFNTVATFGAVLDGFHKGDATNGEGPIICTTQF